MRSIIGFIIVGLCVISCKELKRTHAPGTNISFPQGANPGGTVQPPIQYPNIYPGINFDVNGKPGSFNVKKGDNVTVSWSLQNNSYFKDCVLLGTSITGSVGQYVINNIQESRQLILECTNGVQKQQYTYQIYVDNSNMTTPPNVQIDPGTNNTSNLPIINVFLLDNLQQPLIVAPLSTINMRWEGKNASACTLKFADLLLSGVQGQASIKPANSDTIYISCIGTGGSSVVTIPVVVTSQQSPQAIASKFTVNGQSQSFEVAGEKSLKLSWKCENSASGTVYAGVHRLQGLSGDNQEVSAPISNSTFILVCQDQNGLAKIASVEVKVKATDKPQLNFFINGQKNGIQIPYAGTITLVWSSPGSECSLSDKLGQVEYRSSEASIKLSGVDKTNIYTLLCINAVGSSSESIEVKVEAAPVVTDDQKNSHIKSIKLAGPTQVIAGQCSGPYIISALDAEAKPTNAQTRITATIIVLNSSDLLIYDSPECTTSRTNVHIEPNTSEASPRFYVKALQIGSTPQIKPYISPIEVTANSLDIDIVKGPAKGLKIDPMSQLVNTGSCLKVRVHGITDLGDISTFAEAQTIQISGTNSIKLYGDSLCSNPASSISLPSNTQTALFYIKDSVIESSMISAKSTNVNVKPATDIEIKFVASGGHMGQTQETFRTIESIRYKYAAYYFGRKITAVELIKKLSSAPCVLNKHYGFASNYVWTNKGCRFEARILYEP